MRLRLIMAGLVAVAMAWSITQSEIVSFSAAPRRIAPGASVTLKWVTRGMKSVSISWAPAADTRDNWKHLDGLPSSGTLQVQPGHDTVYLLNCECADGGSACASARVVVQVAPN